MKVVNKNVAVKPFQSNHKEQRAVGGLLETDRLTTSLVATQVVFDSTSFSAGETVYFHSDAFRHPAANKKFTHNDIEFILMPEEMVVAFEKASNSGYTL